MELTPLIRQENTPVLLQEIEEEAETEIEGETSQSQSELADYSLAHGKRRRKIIPTRRYSDSNIVATALSVAHSLNDTEPLNFKKL